MLAIRNMSRQLTERHFKKYQNWLKALFKQPEDDALMRQYIRHPSTIPLHFHIQEDSMPVKNRIRDVSVGGLCFATDRPMTPGTKIRIHIPLVFDAMAEAVDRFDDLDVQSKQFAEEEVGFDADGYVAWCKSEEDKFAVGVQFDDQNTQFGVRMVEQVCHIEQYRREEGVGLDKEQAAKEWVERYAADFPQ